VSLPLFLYGTDLQKPLDPGHLDPDQTLESECCDANDSGRRHRGTRAPKAYLLALVRHLHVLQPPVDIPHDISMRLAFSGWCSLVPVDHTVVLAAVQRVLEPVAALVRGGLLAPTGEAKAPVLMPNLSRLVVSSCNEYTWRLLELGGGGIAAFQALLHDCQRVIPALLTALRPTHGRQTAVGVEWIQQATHGPFVLPAARIIDLIPPTTTPGGLNETGDKRSESGGFGGVFVSDLQSRGCCFPPIVNGVRNIIKYGQPQRDRWGSGIGLAKALVKMFEEIGQGFRGDMKAGTVVVLEGLLGPKREEGDEAIHAAGQDGIRNIQATLLQELDEAVGARWMGRIELC